MLRFSRNWAEENREQFGHFRRMFSDEYDPELLIYSFDETKPKEAFMLFEVAILEVPTKKESEEGAEEKLVLGPVAIVAKDKETATMLAAKGLTDISPSRMKVLVRPFV